MGRPANSLLDEVLAGLNPQEVAEMIPVVRGIADGCQQAGCALVGGETAELPGMYAPGHYDLAGFCVGVVERDQILDGSAVRPGDRALGLGSSGFHSNGYSLVRRALLGPDSRLKLSLEDHALRDALLAPTRIYARALRAARAAVPLRAAAHITGGGLCDNPPRVMPAGTVLRLHTAAWPVPPLMQRLHDEAGVPMDELRRTFNLGIGMVVVTSPQFLQFVQDQFHYSRQPNYIIGEVVDGDGKVKFV